MRKVIVRGAVFNYEDKAPYVRSGKSIHGVLELDDSETKIKCHECGRFFEFLGSHVAQGEKMDVSEYKHKHGLKKQSSLLAPVHKERYRLRLSTAVSQGRLGGEDQMRKFLSSQGNRLGIKGPRFETRNTRRTCAAQLKADAMALADALQRTPTGVELRAAGIDHKTLVDHLGATDFDTAILECGLVPSDKYRRPCKNYTKTIVVELLRDARFRLGRIPTTDDCKAPLLPSYVTIKNLFGSWLAAMDAAGFGRCARQKAS